MNELRIYKKKKRKRARKKLKKYANL